MSPPDGGPVLPIPTYNNIYVGENRNRIGPGMGLSLRDWFAGMALQGMLAAITPGTDNAKKAAAWAFYYADAMLTEREKEPT